MTEFDVLMEMYRSIITDAEDDRQAVELILERLCSDLPAGVAAVNNEGKFIKLSLQERFNPFGREEGENIDTVFSEQLNELREDVINASMDALAVRTAPKNILKDYRICVFLLEAFHSRFGSLMVFVKGGGFTDDQITLCRCISVLISLIMREKYSRESLERKRKLENVKAVSETLSYSELMATVSIFKELEGNEGLIVASRIADSEGITRSVIVNAIRKLEGAGIIESRSLGMKGTYIKVLNEYFTEEMLKIKK